MICFFKLAVYEVEVIGAMMKRSIGQGTRYSFVKEDKDGGDFHAFVGQAVRIISAIAIKEPMRFHFAQMIAKLFFGVSPKYLILVTIE